MCVNGLLIGRLEACPGAAHRGPACTMAGLPVGNNEQKELLNVDGSKDIMNIVVILIYYQSRYAYSISLHYTVYK